MAFYSGKEQLLATGRGDLARILDDLTVPAISPVRFPAIAVADNSANALDEYREGVWTPTIGGSTGIGGTYGQTYNTKRGTYVKVGQLVWINGFIDLSAKGTIGGNVTVRGLPFTAGSEDAPIPMIWFNFTTAIVTLLGNIAKNGTYIDLFLLTAAAVNVTAVTGADLSNTTTLRFSGCYRAAS